MMDDSDVRKLMFEAINTLMQVYPFPDGSTVDDRLALGIGMAVGYLNRALYAQSRNLPFELEPIKFTFTELSTMLTSMRETKLKGVTIPGLKID